MLLDSNFFIILWFRLAPADEHGELKTCPSFELNLHLARGLLHSLRNRKILSDAKYRSYCGPFPEEGKKFCLEGCKA